MVEIKIKLDDLDYIKIIKNAFPIIKKKAENEKSALATIVKHINDPDESTIVALLELISEKDKEILIMMALEKYKDSITDAIAISAKSDDDRIHPANVEVGTLASSLWKDVSDETIPDDNVNVHIRESESIREAYFNCTIEHLYGSEWDGIWDCDFEIDIYKMTVKFCTKYWLFSEYLELSWDQFIDGSFHIIDEKLYYENQSLTMDAEMLPAIEAAQTELKEIRKQYAVLKIKPDGKKAAEAAIRAGQSVTEAYYDCVIEHFFGFEWDGEWDLDFEIDDENNVVKCCTEYGLFNSKYLELSWDRFIDGNFHLISEKVYYENQPLTMDAKLLPLIEEAQIELKEIRKRYLK